jgi:hypothetical protein
MWAGLGERKHGRDLEWAGSGGTSALEAHAAFLSNGSEMPSAARPGRIWPLTLACPVRRSGKGRGNFAMWKGGGQLVVDRREEGAEPVRHPPSQLLLLLANLPSHEVTR